MALSDGLVGYWSAWQGSSGYTLLDRARSNHGTLTNMDAGTDWVGSSIRGESGLALEFDNTNDRVDFSVLTAINSGEVTFGFWYYPFSVSGTNGIFSNWSATVVNVGFVCFRNAAGISFQQPTSGGRVTTSSILTANAWHHIVCRRANGVGGLRIFCNGVLDAASSTSGGDQASTAVFNLCGNYGGIGNGNCRVADFAIWSRSVSDIEIQDLYRLGPGWYQPYKKRGYGYAAAVAGFKAYWHRRETQLIGGGLR